ncbi:MAG: transketolase [Chitinophagales bacterium]|nr:transketolase [Chitinophagales bacterium]MDW8427808.1 transketolase [Chitinophagales bacterium]
MTQRTIEELKLLAAQIRRDVLRMVHGAQSGHPGGSLGCADFFAALYFRIMRHRLPFNMQGKGEDVFVLSNGHISPVWYSTLARSGYFPLAELKTFRKINSRLQGHPATHEGLPGVRVATGSLGQGLSVAIGMALAKRLDNDPYLVFSLHGDGELQEGQCWEAAMFAAHHRIDNLIATVDWNGQQIDGPTVQVMNLGDLKAKFEAFGWLVLNCNGNVMEEVVQQLETAKAMCGQGKPVVMLMKTHMGYPVDFMMDNHEWHGVAPNDEQLERALAQIPVTLGDY